MLSSPPCDFPVVPFQIPFVAAQNSNHSDQLSNCPAWLLKALLAAARGVAEGEELEGEAAAQEEVVVP